VKWFLISLFVFTFETGALVMKSDCTPAELKALQGPDILNQFVLKGSVLALDCTPIGLTPEREVLLVTQVFNAPGGYEAYLSVFERKGLHDSTIATFKSAMLGFSLLPVLYKGEQRLLFVQPSPEKGKLTIYLNVQSGPSATRFARWELNWTKFALVEVPGRYWPLEVGIMPKIYDEKGKWRALIDTRSVEI
jgi:hypothetical protein